MLTELRRMDEHNENFNKGIGNIREYQTLSHRLKNALEGFNSRLDEAEEQVSKLEDKAMELNQTEKKKKKKQEKVFKNEDN